ncbi:FAD-dependent oxidoreductase [Clostridium sp.]|uniref:oxidoreductase n=1 Tax=Clostridium sp. TaxID=1506 RepID=UPI00262D649B|nr:FAD-dependent oxidoreductase [Clostridium sp.]
MKSKLYSPLKISNLTLKNRVGMAPMTLGYEAKDGSISPESTDFWRERAKGGVGMIVVDAVTVDPKVPYLGHTMTLGDDRLIPSFKEFTDEMHKYDAKVFPQIMHPGPESISWTYGVKPVGPSNHFNGFGKEVRELSIKEIEEIIEMFGDSAKRAKEAGCDGIQLHCAHAYMLAGSFLSPLRNKRTDKYGGSLDGRSRFVMEVIKNIKEKVGDDFPILMRISGDERVSDGNRLTDMLYYVRQFEKAGVHAFEISGATQYEHEYKLIPFQGEKAGINVDEAKAIKEVVDVPVFVVGKINDGKFAEHLIDDGFVDGVMIGRGLLADPEFVNKSMAGEYEDIKSCTSCGAGCVTREKDRPFATCAINPECGREREMKIIPAEIKKKVVVVGGGPAGLEAARVLKIRGHEVILLEGSDRLGGQVNPGIVPPHKQEMSKWISYYNAQMEKLKIDVRLNTMATKENIEEIAPDALIIATGAVTSYPPIKGLDKEKALNGIDILKGKMIIPAGNVLVVGGSAVGCEFAEFLVEKARGPMNVHIIEMLEQLMPTVTSYNRVPILNRLRENNVKISTSTKLLEIREDNTVDVELSTGDTTSFGPYTHIVFCSGTRPNNNLSENISVPEIYKIGDVNGPGLVMHAVKAGADIARII